MTPAAPTITEATLACLRAAGRPRTAAQVAAATAHGVTGTRYALATLVAAGDVVEVVRQGPRGPQTLYDAVAHDLDAAEARILLATATRALHSGNWEALRYHLDNLTDLVEEHLHA